MPLFYVAEGNNKNEKAKTLEENCQENIKGIYTPGMRPEKFTVMEYTGSHVLEITM